MIWIVLQNKTGAVNLDGVIDIFIKQSKNEIVARIAPTMVAKDSSLSSFVDLGTYKDTGECKKVLGGILKEIQITENKFNKIIKMPPIGGDVSD